MAEQDGSVVILKKIRIENFKGIKELSLDFSDKYTILVGQNGVGKTSILEAVNLSLRFLMAHVVSGVPRTLTPETDIRLGAMQSNFLLAIEIGNKNFEVEFILNRNSALGFSKKTQSNLRQTLSDISLALAEGDKQYSNFMQNSSNWPLLCFYDQGRSKFAINKQVKSNNKPIMAYTPDNGIVSYFETWFDDRDAEEARAVRNTSNLNHKDPQLEAARAVISNATGFKEIYYSKNSPEGIKVKKDNLEIGFAQMSSGEKAILFLMGDMARRCGLLNNSHPFDVVGIVLIDEIDMHLHPVWQRQIVETLTKYFPKIQFIITTHSPQVIGEVHSENIRILSKSSANLRVERFSRTSYGRDSNYLLETVLGGDMRKKTLKKQLKKLDTLIATNELEKARASIKKIKLEYGEDFPELSIPEARLNRRSTKE